MQGKTKKGMDSLMESYNHDLENKWRPKDELDAHLQWVLDRADKYASFCGTTREKVLEAWESKRDYWWLNYYQDSKQPDPETFHTPVLFYDQWIEKGRLLYGDDMLDWKFKCPACGHVQSLRDFASKGVDPGYGAANCASRFNLGGQPDCKWTTGGLFRIGGAYVINPNFIPVLIFDFADALPEKGKSFRPGDIVQIQGLGGQLDGKVGEVVSLLPDGTAEVRVANIKINGPKDIVTTVKVSPIPTGNLFLDGEATEKLRSGKGGVIIR